MRVAIIALSMFIFWMVLSGYLKLWLVGSGVVMAVSVALVARHMGFADKEGHPVGLLPRALVYWSWLLVEIVKSALSVARIVLDPRLPISPTMVSVKATQKTAVGLTTFANSITLTPATISVEVSSRNKTILVHGLTRQTTAILADGEMDRRVSWFESGTP